MTKLVAMDATALALIAHDVAGIEDAELANPTPCDGWTVNDLVAHMNREHAAVIAAVLPRLDDVADDPRAGFPYIAAHWIVALSRPDPTVIVPKVGHAVPVRQVLSVHIVDMLVHRWDLSRAVGRECVVPKRLTDYAEPIATAITQAGSPLTGPGRAYRSPYPDDMARSAMDRIVARLGRNPCWSADGR